MDKLQEYLSSHKYSNINDIRGKRYGKVVVIEFSKVDKYFSSVWMCKCDCGNVLEISLNRLNTKWVTSCGCTPMQRKFEDLTGKKFGKLTVLSIVNRVKVGERIKWKCRCECGKIKITSSKMLKNGRSKHCGCSKNAKGINLKHGGKGTPEYNIWASMKARCYNKKSAAYQYYGGRGITVCESWKNSFVCFLKDMGKRPSLELSIDRINNDGNYEPSNCRWATIFEQNKNRRKPSRNKKLINKQ